MPKNARLALYVLLDATKTTRGRPSAPNAWRAPSMQRECPSISLSVIYARRANLRLRRALLCVFRVVRTPILLVRESTLTALHVPRVRRLWTIRMRQVSARPRVSMLISLVWLDNTESIRAGSVSRVTQVTTHPADQGVCHVPQAPIALQKV